MADLARYNVALEAETAKYRRELERANRKLARFDRDQRKTLDKINGSFNAAARGVRRFAAGMAALAGVGAIRGLASFGAELDNISVRLGINVESLQELSFAAASSGVKFNELATSLQRAERRISEAAKGMGEAQAAIRELGLDAQRLSLLSIDQQFRVLGQALSEVENDADQVRIAFKLFDSEGVKMLQFLKDGTEGLDEFAEQARKLGAVLAEEDVENLAELDRMFAQLGATTKVWAAQLAAFSRDVGRDFGDWIDDVADKLEPLVDLYDEVATAAQRAAAAMSGNFVIQTHGGGPRDPDLPPPETASPRVIDASILTREVDRDAVDELNRSEKELQAIAERNKKRLEEERKLQAEFQALQEFTDEKAFASARELAEKEDALSNIFHLRELERVEDMNAEREKFAALFAENLVIAAEGGFDELLEQWARTLQQMLAQAIATELFEALFPEGLFTEGGALSEVPIIGEFFAEGGFIKPGEFGIVGEEGPEFAFAGRKGVKQLLDNEPIIVDGPALMAGGGSGMTIVPEDKFEGFFAEGGFIPPGSFGVVGENGPEFAFGGSAGATIMPADAGGITIQNQDVHVQGSIDPARDLVLVETAINSAVAKVADSRRRGR